ncbi:MAG TPA: Type 1 glutamine amidotransferase-like domain-containing protein [Thermomicrobiales bacterium]|jgi:dipeptidase E|nr:Type 1 glutamine amidotransferase-like domain-containing protein [Thermomicrobiales bacterium]
MMYLSSYRLGNNPRVLHRNDGDGRAGIILNALDVYGETRAMNLGREIADLEMLGYRSEEIDLRDYFADGAGLAARLALFDLVWIVGGNTFALARAMTASGFRDALLPALERGMIYAGYSAGSCVTCPDLDGIHLIDDPGAVPEGYDPDIPPTTLGLIPFRIVPHWRSDHPESEMAETAAAYMERKGLSYRTLRDGEAIVVGDDGTIEVRS